MLPLTPAILCAAYNYLNETAPFHRWNLPDGDDVHFSLCRSKHVRGWYWFKNGRHYIRISSGCIATTGSLMATMAHEMVHLHEQATKCNTGEHTAAFHKWAAQVCKVHGFDLYLF